MSLLVDTSHLLQTHRKRKYHDSEKSIDLLYDDYYDANSIYKVPKLDILSQAMTNIHRKYPPPKVRRNVIMTRDFSPNCGEDCATLCNVVDSLSKQCKELTRMDRKYPPPKLRKSVTMTRNFPPNCGEDCATFTNVSMELCKLNEESSPPNCGEDCATFTNVSVELCKLNEESSDIFSKGSSDGNVAKDESEFVCVNDNPSKNFQHFYLEEDLRREDLEMSGIVIQGRGIVMDEDKGQLKSNVGMDEMIGCSDEDEYHNMAERSIHNHDENEIKDLSTVPYDEHEPKDACIVTHDATGREPFAQVQEALKLFKEIYDNLYREYIKELKGERATKQIHFEAARRLRNEQKWVNSEPIIGTVPGVEVGDTFQFRVELALVGLHHEFMSGINCVTIDGKKHANSVVDSGRYQNKVLSRDVFLYSGQGGNPKLKQKRHLQTQVEDQKLEGVNLSLKRSMDAKLPIRVIRKISHSKHASDNKTYIYEGLYHVRNYWQEKQVDTMKLAFMFEMVRVPGQPEIVTGSIEKICRHPSDLSQREERIPTRVASDLNNKNNICSNANYLSLGKEKIPARVVHDSNNMNHICSNAIDLSQGKEKIPIRVVNDLNNKKPQSFTYITEMKYQSCLNWIRISEPNGCDCIDGCSDYKPCSCVVKNGGEIPFNEQGSIVRAKRLVHECGPLCKCPPSCQNRVSQLGPKFELEVFKTKSIGWGIRSREEIPSGSFICEYIGELLHDKDAEERTNDEYLFDLGDHDDFTIDAAKYGNIGRFINHSCSPNLYAQNVLYDNEDKRLPHIMFFATKKIPAFQELTYDYNYKLNRVCDSKGKIKKKLCRCGSRKCSGRMY